MDVEAGRVELVLPPILQAGMDACDMRGRAGDEKAMRVQPGDHPVVEDDASLLQQEL